MAELSGGLGRRGRTRRRRRRPAQRAEGARRRHHRRPDGHRPRPVHPPRRPRRRADRPQHRRRDRRLHLQRRARCTSTIRARARCSAAPEPMIELFVRDIEEGIADTGRQGRDPQVRHRRARRDARRRAGAARGGRRPTARPACRSPRTPTPATRRGLEQQRIFAEEGVDLSPRGHRSLRRLHRPRLPRGADRSGSYLGMDRFGLGRATCRFEDRVDTVATMCERGPRRQDGALARRVVLHRLRCPRT